MSIFVFVVMAALAMRSIWSTNRGIEQLLINYAESSASYAIRSNDYLSIQRDLNNLHEAMYRAFATRTQIDLYIGGVRVAQTYDAFPYSFAISNIEHEVKTVDGKDLRFEIAVHHGRAVLELILLLLVLQGLILSAMMVSRRSTQNSLSKITKNLSRSVEWTSTIAEKLRKEDEAIQPLPDSDIAEISKLISSMNLMSTQVLQLKEELKQREYQRGQFELATQVAHDIRSPLMALRFLEPELQGVPEAVRESFVGVIQRINDIANDLLKKKRESESVMSIVDLSILVDEIIQEKKIQYKNLPKVQIIFEKFGNEFRTRVEEKEFKRMFSNILNNAFEAFEDEGQIKVKLSSADSNLTLVIEDNGKGMPAEILKRVHSEGGSFGKSGGSGLGLSHAKKTMLAWGGSLSIQSVFGAGSSVTLNFAKG